jgi:predicted PurR-regulated permease PerM
MKYKKDTLSYITFIIIFFIILFLFYTQTNKSQEPFISYLNSRKNEISRKVRYQSQYLKKNFNDYVNKIKKLLYK